MSRISMLMSLSAATLAVFLIAPAFGEVVSLTGQPVDGEVPGVVLEINQDETGMTEVYFQSYFEDIGVLILTNGDPAMGANDLEQFGGILQEGMSCQGSVNLQAVNGNLVGATLGPPVPNVLCCISGLCSSKPARSCTRAGGTTGFSSWTDCKRRCV